MALYQSVLAAFVIIIAFSHVGECLHVFVGDSATFPQTEKCPIGKPATIEYVTGNRVVAERVEGVWKATKDYEDRVNPNSIFAFSRTFYTDTGLYVLKCDGREENIQLDVVEGSEASLTEGEEGKLPCYFSTDIVKIAHSLRWEKHEETVLKLNLSTGEITYGTGFNNETVTLYPNGKEEGEWSLIFLHPQMEDEGDYFCFVLKNGLKEKWARPAAVRMKVTEKKNPDQTTIRPPLSVSTPHCQNDTENGTWKIVAIIAFVVVAIIAASWLGCYLKFWRARKSSGSGGERPSDVALEPLNSEPPSPANGSNGVNGVAHSSHAESIP